MKKFVLVMALGVSASTAFGQANAIMNLETGKLDKAKEDIDKASQDAKLSTKAKTWLYKGKIYENIANDRTGIYGKLDSSAATTAYAAYKKAIELDKPNGSFAKDAQAALSSQSLYYAILNQGAQKLQNDKQAEAAQIFQLAQEANPKDTLAPLYLGDTYQRTKDYKNAAVAWEKYVELGGKNPQVYSILASLYQNEKEYDKALATLQKGIEVHPGDKTMRDQQLNIYLTSGKTQEAIDNLKKSLEKEPGNVQYLLNLGILNDNAGNKQEALGYYKQVLEKDPNNFDGNYNLGVYHFNQAVEVSKKLNGMDLKQYQKDGKKVEAEVQAKFNEALPYFEKAHQSNPKDVSAMENLRKVYQQLKRTADAERITKAIEAAEASK